MTQQEFNHIVVYGTDEEVQKAMREHPDLMEACAEGIRKRLQESPLRMDELDYLRLVDRGLEEVVEYDYTDDL